MKDNTALIDQRLELSTVVRKQSLTAAILLSLGVLAVLASMFASYIKVKSTDKELRAKTEQLATLNHEIEQRNEHRDQIEAKIALDQKQLSAYANLLPLIAEKLPKGDSFINEILQANPQVANGIPRLKLEIAEGSSKDEARRIMKALRDEGYAVPGIGQVDPAKIPIFTELRYFYEDDAKSGTGLMKLQEDLKSLNIKVALAFHRRTKADQEAPDRNQYELWLSTK